MTSILPRGAGCGPASLLGLRDGKGGEKARTQEGQAREGQAREGQAREGPARQTSQGERTSTSQVRADYRAGGCRLARERGTCRLNSSRSDERRGFLVRPDLPVDLAHLPVADRGSGSAAREAGVARAEPVGHEGRRGGSR